VSQSPYVWKFTDTDGDDKADKKEILFQGIEGEQHDHGVHTFVFDSDGKLYFNFGNEGRQLKDAKGNLVKDQFGREISRKNFQEGMLFRCNLDGSEVECLAQNFRNNYEVAVDSYGTLWQSDNDDDGNKGCVSILSWNMVTMAIKIK
jgi:glucose/arabinose dehydrogenase